MNGLARWLGLFGLFIVMTATVSAQDPSQQSHIPLSDDAKIDLKKRLTEQFGKRAQKAVDFDLFRKMLKVGPKPNLLDLHKLLRDNPALQNPEERQRLLKLVQGMIGEQGGTPPNLDQLKQVLEKIQTDPNLKKDPVDPNDPTKAVTPPIEPSPPPPMPTIEDLASKISSDSRTKDWAKWAEKNFGPLSENPAIRDALTDFVNGDFGEWNTDAAEWLNDLKQYEGEFKDLGSWLEGQVGSPSGWELPKFDWGSSGSGISIGGGGGGSGYGAGGTRELSWAPVIVLFLILFGGLIYWWVRGMESKDVVVEPTIEERLGPWPVDPRQIRTQEQLIKAYDYLALTECGLETKAWHHIAIAEELGGRYPANQDEVSRLTGLYEHARYAPQSMPLSATQIDAGRRDLCQLIGVPVA